MAVRAGGKQVTWGEKVLGDGTIGREETLGVARGLKPDLLQVFMEKSLRYTAPLTV